MNLTRDITTLTFSGTVIKRPFLIGVGGQFGSGKDVFCNYLVDRLNELQIRQWHRGAFASNVKRIYCETFGVDKDFIEEWKRKDECPPGFQRPVRAGLTFIGDGFRDIQHDIWINLLLKNNKKNLIISDIRYINECNSVRSNNGITVLLWRPGHENSYQNRSEQELVQFVDKLKYEPDGLLYDDSIPFDVWIKNDGSLDDLYAKVDNILIPLVLKNADS